MLLVFFSPDFSLCEFQKKSIYETGVVYFNDKWFEIN